MYGWCRLVEETDSNMIIGYSWQDDNSCDGRLKFDKKTKEMLVSKLSSSADNDETAYLIVPFRSRIRKGMIKDKLYMVATG